MDRYCRVAIKGSFNKMYSMPPVIAHHVTTSAIKTRTHTVVMIATTRVMEIPA